jgi:hypothetical protein
MLHGLGNGELHIHAAAKGQHYDEERKPAASIVHRDGAVGAPVNLRAFAGSKMQLEINRPLRRPDAADIIPQDRHAALVRGEPVRAPAGRADDFVWPRRGVAPFGSDPVVATTDLPMTPMTTATMGAATPSTKLATAAAPPAKPAAPRRVTLRPPAYAYVQSMYRPDYRRPPVQGLFNFQSLFGGRW